MADPSGFKRPGEASSTGSLVVQKHDRALRLPPSAVLSVDLGAKGTELGAEFGRDLDAIQQRLAESSAPAALRLPAVTLEVESVGRSLAQILEAGYEAGLLADARRAITEERYDHALSLLDDLMLVEPGNLEACYLRALCHHHEGNLEAALRALRPLRVAELGDDLGARVHDLREQVRTLMPRQVILAFLGARHRDPDAARARLREIIELDPEAGVYYLVLADALAAAGDLEEALNVTREGQENATDYRGQLAALSERIRSQLVGTRVDPAVEKFKKSRYLDAQRYLDKLSDEWRTLPVAADFRAYLGQLTAQRTHPRRLPPTGPPERVDALYFLLAGKDVDQARRMADRGELEAAERVLGQALRFVPRFPFANFLYAGVIFGSVTRSFTDQGGVDVAAQADRLGTAAAAAEIATTDPEIRQARQLAEAIAALRAFLTAARDHQAARQQEAEAINPVTEEFQSIMNVVRGGAVGDDTLESIYTRLQALRARMPAVGRAAVSADAKEIVAQLEKAIEQNLADAERLVRMQRCFREYKEIKESARGGIKTELQLGEVLERLEKLRGNIERSRKDAREAGDKQSRQQLDKLAEAVEKDVGGLLRARKGRVGTRDKAETRNKVGPRDLAWELNAVKTLLSQMKVPPTGQNADVIAGILDNIAAEARSRRSNTSDRWVAQQMREIEQTAEETARDVRGSW